MGKFLLLIFGIGAGFVIAHQVSRTERGQQFFDDVDARTKRFTAALIDGYHQREAELREFVAEAQDAADDLR